MAGTQFHVSNGQIIDPDGNVFVARGMDIGPQDMTSVAQSLGTTFPGTNFIRLATWDTAPYSMAQYQNFVSQMTAKGIVVEFEDHAYPSPGTYTGAQLATESAWYASLAATFANNPYVWFGTMNEPNSGTYGPSEAAISTQEVATYNAIRGAGNNSMIMMELDGGGNPGSVGAGFGMTPSSYSGMTNIAWDLHYYGWSSGYSTDQATVTADLMGSASGGYGIAAAQSITSADGTVPVIIGEFGNSTDGSNVDANGNQVISAVLNSGYGYAAWTWGGSGGPDQLTNNEAGGAGSLTPFGQQVAAGIAAAAAARPTPTPAPTPTPGPTPTASKNDTVVTGTSAAIVDASGNKWTITGGGQVAINGAADTTTGNVIELAYVNGTIWQQNTSKLWWGETTPNAAWSPQAGTATSPLPATPPPTPTPTPAPAPTPAPTPTPAASKNDTVVTGTSAAIVDASGNKWTITGGGQVAINGAADTTTGNVIELAYVNGTIWQQNTSKLWWGETTPNAAWSPQAGTATSPLPATPPPTPTASKNDTVVTGTSAAIVDASGNKWTITGGGQVAINGAADTTTGNVIELAYVNGTIWQQNTSKLWWGETTPNAAWSPQAGTATSPLPATPPPTPTPPPTSANDTMVLAGASTAIVDASGNKWTITGSGQVAVNGTADTTTANVSELAYVNKQVWQENASQLWWGKASPSAAWAPDAGTATSPLPAPISLTAASATVSASQVSVVATAGAHMLFLNASGDVVSLSGGAETVTDSGAANTYILPAAGHGSVSFTSNILTTADVLDLKPALAATNWNGAAATLANYLTVSDQASGATLSIAATSGGAGVAIASIAGASSANLSSLLAHAIT